MEKHTKKTKETKKEKKKKMLWTVSVENLTRYDGRIRL